MKKLLVIVAAAGALPFVAHAESNFVSDTGAMTASARLDFVLTVPKVLYLQVGSGVPYLDSATVDIINFTIPAGAVGNGTAVPGIGGDLPGGGVTVRVMGNSGSVSLTNATTGPLSSGVAGNPTVPWSAIAVAAGTLPVTSAGYTNAAISHPPFNTGPAGGSSTAPTVLTASGGLVRQEGSWTFSYANAVMLPSGTYGSSPSNNGVVTYTASVP